MDDLSSLDWSQPTKPAATPPVNPSAGSSTYASFRPPSQPPVSSASPFLQGSGRSTPLSAQVSGIPANIASKFPSSNAATKATTGSPAPASGPGFDNFSNLVNFGSAKTNANLSMKEQQAKLEAERKIAEDERRKQVEAQFGNGQFWDTLGSGNASRVASPAIAIAPPATTATDDDDLFAAFKAETKVDNASHYPPPAALDLTSPAAWGQLSGTAGAGGFDNDDDPFGLNQLKPATTSTTMPVAAHDEDDDFLGDLGRPVEEVRRKQPQRTAAAAPTPTQPDSSDESSSDEEGPAPAVPRSSDPFDRAVAQLIDYGFSAEDARRGLTESGAGVNVQAAANWLLDDAHKKAKEKARAARGRGQDQARDGERTTRPQPESDTPGWMRGERNGSPPRRADGASPLDGDLAKTAAAMGTTLFKTANSLWKTGQKKVQKAVAELQQPDDPNQPKWMRNAQLHERGSAAQNNLTNEAAMLESGGRREKPERPSSRATPDMNVRTRGRSPTISAHSSGRNTPKWQQSGSAAAPMDSRTRLSRSAKDEDEMVAYVSRNRRRTPQPEQSTSRLEPKQPPRPESEPDLLFERSSSATPSIRQRPTSAQPQPAQPPPKPAAPPRRARQIPPIDSSALLASNRHRLAGTSHFKRGDYATAHESYTSALQGVPETHPLAIILLTNRALTHLKTGSPKLAAEDADAALKVIGPGGGVGELVAVAGEPGAEEKREMRDLYGKALSRKAEALEQMERFGDASAVWQLCVEGGVGGATAIQGRQRCQTALAPKPKPRTDSNPTPAPPKRPSSALSSLGGGQQDSEAVARLRQANEAAAREDDEKFALADKVDARISAWRDGKTDNLRALLGSLDRVLWEGSGWNKVGLADLVMANKVKIAYMKAIAKTHPDKLPQDATTEVKLLAATVFSTLNESYDKFKVENKL